MRTAEDFVHAGLEMREDCFDSHGFEMDAPNCFPVGSTVKKLSFFRYSGTISRVVFR